MYRGRGLSLTKILLYGLTNVPIECDLHVHIGPKSGNLTFEFRNRRTGEREVIKHVKAETG